MPRSAAQINRFHLSGLDLFAQFVIYRTTTLTENIVGSETQLLSEVGDIPFHDDSNDVTTGNEIVSFATVQSPVVETVPAPADVNVNLLTNLQEGRDHSIIDILCREYHFLDFDIPVGGTIGDTIQNIDVLSAYLSNANVFEKLAGFAYFRSALRFRFEITTLPTNTGGIIFAFSPAVDVVAINNRSLLGIPGALQASQKPNIQQSLTTSQSVTLQIPWINPLLSYDINQDLGSMGRVSIIRLTPSTGLPIKVRAYVSAVKDLVYVQYPSPNTVVPISIRRKQLEYYLQKVRFLESLPEVQGKKGTEVNAMQKEGAISGILSAGGKIATIASGIPVIGSVASMVAPILNVGASLAAAFGFSKPSIDKPLRTIRFKPADAHLTSEGAIPNHLFSIHQDCQVDSQYNPFGSEADEMTIEAICQTPNIVRFQNISTANPPGFVLAQFDLNMAQRVSISTDFVPSHQMWVSQLFSLWNATLNFDFDVYLTHFHRVKLRFLVLPNYYPLNLVGTVLPPTFDINMASSEIVEFSGDQTNHSISISPRSNTNMKYTPTPFIEGNVIGTNRGTSVDFTNNSNTLACSYGTLLVCVEVPLVASDTVSSTVSMISSFSASDVCLSFPKMGLDFVPAVQGSSTLGTDFAKMSRSERMIRGAVGLTSNSVTIDSVENLKVSAGDRALSVKNLMNAYSYNKTVAPTPVNTIWIAPFARHANLDTDLYDYLAVGYAFGKGGMNVRLVPTDSTGNLTALVGVWNDHSLEGNTQVSTGTDLVSIPGTNTLLSSGARLVPLIQTEGCFDLNTPYYQQKHMLDNFGSPSSYMSRYMVRYAIKFVSPSVLHVFRAPADDFRFGFLWALPRMSPNIKAVYTATALADNELSGETSSQPDL